MLAASRAWDDTLYPRAARDRLRRGQLTTPAPAPSGLSGLKKQREGQQAHPSCEDFSMGEGASRCLADISHTPFIQSSPSLHRQGERGTEGRRGANVPRRHGKAGAELESLSSQPDDPARYML